MAFDIQGARKAGYSDAEIADFLSSRHGFNASGGQAGYSDADILQESQPTRLS